MVKEYYDPLLNQFFGNPKLRAYEDRDRVKESFDAATKIADKKLAHSKFKTQSNTGAFHRLVDGLSLKKVLVGSHGRKPFYALVDLKERVCLPYIEEAKEAE